MKTKIIFFLSICLLLISCNFLKNTLEYEKTTEDFMNTLIHDDVEKSLNYFALKHEMFKNTDINNMRNGLSLYRENFIKTFGTDIEYDLIQSKKTFSTIQEENTPPNTTFVFIQFKNDKEFGVIRVLFDDKSKKIINFSPLDEKYPIPNMTFFWIISILGLLILVFNIYVINKIRKSNLKRKWLKYISIIVFNLPTIYYSAVEGFSYKLFNFIFLGYGFSKMGYLNSIISMGIPIAAIYWFFKLKNHKTKELIQ